MTGEASAAMHAPHTSPAGLAHAFSAPVKSSTTRTGHADGGSPGDSTRSGENLGGGGGGNGQLASAVSDATGTPAATIAPACAVMQAPSVGTSVEDTPAMTKGVASA